MSYREQYGFTYQTVKSAINALNAKSITIEHAKAIANLAKQANNVATLQLETAKFLAQSEKAPEVLKNVGLSDVKS